MKQFDDSLFLSCGETSTVPRSTSSLLGYRKAKGESSAFDLCNLVTCDDVVQTNAPQFSYLLLLFPLGRARGQSDFPCCCCSCSGGGTVRLFLLFLLLLLSVIVYGADCISRRDGAKKAIGKAAAGCVLNT